MTHPWYEEMGDMIGEAVANLEQPETRERGRDQLMVVIAEALVELAAQGAERPGALPK